MGLPMLLVCLAVGANAPPPQAQVAEKVFIAPVRAPALDQNTRRAIFDLVVVAANRARAHTIVTFEDVDALLAHDKRRQLLDCSSITCATDLSGALGVRYLLSTRVEQMNRQRLLTISLIDSVEQRSVSGQAESSLALDDMRVAVATAVAEAFGVTRPEAAGSRSKPVCTVGEPAGAECMSQCKLGIAESCAAVGRALYDGLGVAQDVGQAKTYLATACDEGHVHACSDLGLALFVYPSSATDRTKAIALFKQACDAGFAAACNHLGTTYLTGGAAATNHDAAVDLFKRACDSGDGDGCTNLGHAYLHGDATIRNSTRALEMFKRACDDGSALGCTYLGEAYYRGQFVAQDYVRAAGLFEQACRPSVGRRLGNACAFLGAMYLNGDGVAAETAKAVMLYRAGCEAANRSGFACAWLGHHYRSGEYVPRSAKRADELLKRACASGEPLGCADGWSSDDAPPDRP